MATNTQLAPVTSVLNMKGGVGKTTISAHLFRLLVDRLHKSVLLIDFDPQFNLTQTVLTRASYEKERSADKTIFSVMEPTDTPSLFSTTSAAGPPPLVSSITKTLLVWTETKGVALGLVPGDFRMARYTLVENQKAVQPARQRFLNFVESARKEYGLVCIDCNPSSSFMTICALLASTHLLIPVRPDRYSLLGLELLDEFIAGAPVITSKPRKIIVVNGVPTSRYDDQVENTLRAHPIYGPLTLPNTIKISTLLAAKEGRVGFATDRRVSHTETLKHRLFNVIDDLKVPLGF
jgi:chromosome partitioning protein